MSVKRHLKCVLCLGSEDEGPPAPPQPPPLPPGVTEEDVEIFKRAQENANEVGFIASYFNMLP